MIRHLSARARHSVPVCSLACAALLIRAAAAQSPQAIAYTLRVPAPATHMLNVTARIPTGGRDSVGGMMPIWSPGFYRGEDYAGKIETISAAGPNGDTLTIRRWPAPGNRWTVTTGGAAFVTVTYRLLAEGHSATTDWVCAELRVDKGPAKYV